MTTINIIYILLGIASGLVALVLTAMRLRSLINKADQGPALQAMSDIADAFQKASTMKSTRILELETTVKAQGDEILALRLQLTQLSNLYTLSQLKLAETASHIPIPRPRAPRKNVTQPLPGGTP